MTQPIGAPWTVLTHLTTVDGDHTRTDLNGQKAYFMSLGMPNGVADCATGTLLPGALPLCEDATNLTADAAASQLATTFQTTLEDDASSVKEKVRPILWLDMGPSTHVQPAGI